MTDPVDHVLQIIEFSAATPPGPGEASIREATYEYLHRWRMRASGPESFGSGSPL